MRFRDLDAAMDEVGNIESRVMHDRPDILQSPEETLQFTIAKAQEINHRYPVPATIELDQTDIRAMRVQPCHSRIRHPIPCPARPRTHLPRLRASR